MTFIRCSKPLKLFLHLLLSPHNEPAAKMAKRSAREFAATMEQQMKQFKPVRGEQQQHSSKQPASASAAWSRTHTLATVRPVCSYEARIYAVFVTFKAAAAPGAASPESTV